MRNFPRRIVIQIWWKVVPILKNPKIVRQVVHDKSRFYEKSRVVLGLIIHLIAFVTVSAVVVDVCRLLTVVMAVTVILITAIIAHRGQFCGGIIDSNRFVLFDNGVLLLVDGHPWQVDAMMFTWIFLV